MNLQRSASGAWSGSNDGLDQWEAVFEPGFVATSRASAPEPWIAGHVHVARDLPAQEEPVQTGGLEVHAVVVFDSAFDEREGVLGRPLHYDGPVRPGEMSVVPATVAAEPCFTSWTGGPSSFTSVMLPPGTVAASCRALDRDYARLEFLERYGHRDAFLEHLVRALGTELERGTPGGRLYAEQLLETLAVHLITRYTAEAPRLKTYRGGLPKAKLRRVEEYVRAHLDQELRLDDLAGVAGCSTCHFARAFKQSVGQAPYRYVQARRLERAQRLLREEEGLSIAQVGLSVGYGASHFATWFRRETGMSPSRYRQEVCG